MTTIIKGNLEAIVQKHKEAVERSFTAGQMDVLESMAREMVKALKAGHKLLICGNGGSAADSQHIAAEFIVRFRKERQSLAAIALTTDTSILTATGNDYDFKNIFSRQIEGIGKSGDVLIALSTSGNSSNVLEAVASARAAGIVTCAFTGKDGGQLRPLADLCFVAQVSETSHIQEVHITALHAIAEAIEELFFGS